jgi:hypothetical protein
MHKPQVQGSVVARHRAIERRVPVQKVDTEPEAIAIELGGRPYIANEQDRPRGVQQDGLRSLGWSWRGILDGRPQRGPTVVARLERNDLLRLRKLEVQRERFAIRHLAVSRQLADAATDRVVAVAVPAQELLGLLLVRFEYRHGVPPRVEPE